MNTDTKRRGKRRGAPLIPLVIALAGLAVIAAVFFAPAFAPWALRFEHWTADWRTAYLSERAGKPNPKIVVVIINDETLKDLPSSPIDRGLLAKLVTAIKDDGAKAIGLDILFLKKTDESNDKVLTETLKTSPVVLGALDERGNLQPFQRQYQTEFLAAAGKPVGYLNLRIERDAVVRYAARPNAGSQYPKSFARTLAEQSGITAIDSGDPVPWTLDSNDGGAAISSLKAQDVLANTPSSASQLKDRIVIVGGDFPNRDRHRIPLSVRSGEEVSGVMIHAQMLAGLLDPANAVRELGPAGVRWFLSGVAVTGALLGWLLWQSSVVGFVRWSLATAILVAIDAASFKTFHLLLPFTLALIVWFAGVTTGRALHLFKTSFSRS